VRQLLQFFLLAKQMLWPQNMQINL